MNGWMKEITYDMLQPRQQEIADIIGVEATLKLCEYVQGSGLYIPKNDRAFAKLRNRWLKHDYIQGNWSVGALAKRYNLTEDMVRKIVRDIKPEQLRFKWL